MGRRPPWAGEETGFCCAPAVPPPENVFVVMLSAFALFLLAFGLESTHAVFRRKQPLLRIPWFGRLFCCGWREVQGLVAPGNHQVARATGRVGQIARYRGTVVKLRILTGPRTLATPAVEMLPDLPNKPARFPLVVSSLLPCVCTPRGRRCARNSAHQTCTRTTMYVHAMCTHLRRQKRAASAVCMGGSSPTHATLHSTQFGSARLGGCVYPARGHAQPSGQRSRWRGRERVRRGQPLGVRDGERAGHVLGPRRVQPARGCR